MNNQRASDATSRNRTNKNRTLREKTAMPAVYGNVYIFNIYSSPIVTITLNGGTVAANGIPAPVPPPVTAPALPYTPSQVAVPKCNLYLSQGAPSQFMCGTANPNSITISFDGYLWNAQVYIPGPADHPGMPYDKDLFCYVAFEQLYIFDNDGNNILQPPNNTQSANATASSAPGGGKSESAEVEDEEIEEGE
jgi:hypothetical protein